MRNTAIVAAAVLIVAGFVTVSFATPVTVGPNVPVKITVKGEIKSVLAVTLSDTTINFGTLNVGKQEKSIDVTCAGMGGKPTYMTVANAADLRSAQGKTIATQYGVQMGSGSTDYKNAAQFNGQRSLQANNKLWAKVTPVAASQVGAYSNVMTVTFSQTAQ